MQRAMADWEGLQGEGERGRESYWIVQLQWQGEALAHALCLQVGAVKLFLGRGGGLEGRRACIRVTPADTHVLPTFYFISLSGLLRVTPLSAEHVPGCLGSVRRKQRPARLQVTACRPPQVRREQQKLSFGRTVGSRPPAGEPAAVE